MSDISVTIPRYPELPAAQDYFRLRAEGIDYIRKLGSKQWTDYNTHDPGITLLEALMFAITDLAWRIDWNIEDHLNGAVNQPFYTAAAILTSNPTTPDDYRRLFIDNDNVRNAWVVCKQCLCGAGNVGVKGLYDVYVELESDDVVGDLNDRMIEQTLSVTSGSDAFDITVEARFPDWGLASQDEFEAFLSFADSALTIKCVRFMRSRTSESLLHEVLDDNEELHKFWRDVFFVTLEVSNGPSTIAIPDISLRLFASTEGKNATTVDDIVDMLQTSGGDGTIGLYLRKQLLIAEAIDDAKRTYHAHRNLDEDLCRLAVIDVDHVAVCAEVNVEADADIERVQAMIWFAIEQYLTPSIPFYSLTELRNEGVAVEEIFRGPRLSNGFIKQTDLDAAVVRRVVRGSDIIRLVMAIPGVKSVAKLQMTRYDHEGLPVYGVADPTFVAGEPVFTATRLSASWLLYITESHQPRLYHNLSNFTFSKNGLPFTVDQREAYDTLTQLHGEAERPKQPEALNDIAVPTGKDRRADDISPVQYLLPETYGVGPQGLPSHVGKLRRAQARQLKAYLMVFEQLLGNAFAQVARFDELFSTSSSVAATYFAYEFDDDQIDDYDSLVEGLTPSVLATLTETSNEFLDRRNAFLDHMLARFGLDVSEYALLLTNWKGETVAKQRLIQDKLGILRAYPEISGERARAFNHRIDSLLPSNYTVLKRRVALFLGYPDLRFEWTYDESVPGTTKITSYALVDTHDVSWATGAKQYSADTRTAVTRGAADALLQRLSQASAYNLYTTADGYRLVVRDAATDIIVESPSRFGTVSEAEAYAEELVAWSSVARSIFVEHLLLRPKFPGDAEYRECADCDECDPWSFRMTVVMPGWSQPYNANLDLREFANRTIQYEIPSHLLAKICWVGNDGFESTPCDPIVAELAKIVEAGVVTAAGLQPSCEDARTCAASAYAASERAFEGWYADRKQQVFAQGALDTLIRDALASVSPADIACTLDLTDVWSKLIDRLVEHFSSVVMFGLQFDRFERAWYSWLEEDERFDWGEERLVERVAAMLALRLAEPTTSDLCACALTIVNAFGNDFKTWMTSNVATGSAYEDFPAFVHSEVDLCAGAEFTSGTGAVIADYLAKKYAEYGMVSYRLTVLTQMLELLTNTYPSATLHDCDDGSDANPVRLNQTALGALTIGSSDTIRLVPQPEPPNAAGRSRRRPRR